MVKWIAKANDDVISHCRCENALASPSGQADCPWCGCGWMIGCMECRRAFVFARIIEVDQTCEALLAEDARRRGIRNVPDEGLSEYAAWMQEALAPFPVGATIVYFDGEYFSVDAVDVAFEGLYARHQLDRLPHAIAREQPDYLRSALSNPTYWREREREDRD